MLQTLSAQKEAEWSLSAPNRLVKVFSPSAINHQIVTDTVDWENVEGGRRIKSVQITGFFTLEKYLIGKTSLQIEAALGLRPGELAVYANIYSFSRLPNRGEYQFKGFCDQPDGQNVMEEGSEERETFIEDLMLARENYLKGVNLRNRSMTPVVDVYVPGDKSIPQWELNKGVKIPSGKLIATTTPLFPLPAK